MRMIWIYLLCFFIQPVQPLQAQKALQRSDFVGKWTMTYGKSKWNVQFYLSGRYEATCENTEYTGTWEYQHGWLKIMEREDDCDLPLTWHAMITSSSKLEGRIFPKDNVFKLEKRE